jgi:hypothetical protein
MYLGEEIMQPDTEGLIWEYFSGGFKHVNPGQINKVLLVLQEEVSEKYLVIQDSNQFYSFPTIEKNHELTTKQALFVLAKNLTGFDISKAKLIQFFHTFTSLPTQSENKKHNQKLNAEVAFLVKIKLDTSWNNPTGMNLQWLSLKSLGAQLQASVKNYHILQTIRELDPQ